MSDLSTIGFYDIGALVVRIGFWNPLYFNLGHPTP